MRCRDFKRYASLAAGGTVLGLEFVHLCTITLSGNFGRYFFNLNFVWWYHTEFQLIGLTNVSAALYFTDFWRNVFLNSKWFEINWNRTTPSKTKIFSNWWQIFSNVFKWLKRPLLVPYEKTHTYKSHVIVSCAHISFTCEFIWSICNYICFTCEHMIYMWNWNNYMLYYNMWMICDITNTTWVFQFHTSITRGFFVRGLHANLHLFITRVSRVMIHHMTCSPRLPWRFMADHKHVHAANGLNHWG